MKLYVGLDVGLDETSLCIVDREGLTVREVKVSTEPEAIRSAVESYADRLDRVGVEASSLGIWLYRELQPAGLPIIVVEARQLRVSLSTMRNKTDRNDARGIAQMMRLGWYRAVHVKNIEMQKMRSLLANRKLLKRKLVDLENHIRGTLRAYGLMVGAVGRGGYEARVRELIEHSDPVFCMMIEAMLDVRRAIFEGYERLHKVLLQVVQHDAICRRLMTVPGVGPVAALSFKVGVDDPLRFARSRTVGAHFGLTPRRHQSGTSSTTKAELPNRATSRFARRSARRQQACCYGSGNGRRCGRGACGSPNGRACCARSSRSHASLRASCTGCGSIRPTSTLGSAPRSHKDCV
ncbi:transposase [Bradyrhizobium sp. JR4.1]